MRVACGPRSGIGRHRQARTRGQVEDVRKLPQAVDTVVDALVVGVRQRWPVGKVLFGSVVQGVVLDSGRPVVVAPAEE